MFLKKFFVLKNAYTFVQTNVKLNDDDISPRSVVPCWSFKLKSQNPGRLGQTVKFQIVIWLTANFEVPIITYICYCTKKCDSGLLLKKTLHSTGIKQFNKAKSCCLSSDMFLLGQNIRSITHWHILRGEGGLTDLLGGLPAISLCRPKSMKDRWTLDVWWIFFLLQEYAFILQKKSLWHMG